jgi:hypothetical protein
MAARETRRSRHVKALFEFIEALFSSAKTSTGDARQFVVLFSEDFGLRVEFLSEDLLEAFLGELGHRCEVNGEEIISWWGESVKDSPSYFRVRLPRGAVALPPLRFVVAVFFGPVVSWYPGVGRGGGG